MGRLRGRMLWLVVLVMAALALLAPFSDVIVAVLLGAGVLVAGSVLFRGLGGNRGPAGPGPPTVRAGRRTSPTERAESPPPGG